MKLLINFCFQISLKPATDCCQIELPIQRDALRTMLPATELPANDWEWTKAN